jgi:hypothetical protein
MPRGSPLPRCRTPGGRDASGQPFSGWSRPPFWCRSRWPAGCGRFPAGGSDSGGGGSGGSSGRTETCAACESSSLHAVSTPPQPPALALRCRSQHPQQLYATDSPSTQQAPLRSSVHGRAAPATSAAGQLHVGSPALRRSSHRRHRAIGPRRCSTSLRRRRPDRPGGSARRSARPAARVARRRRSSRAHLPAGEALADDLRVGEDGREGPAVASAERPHRRGGKAALRGPHGAAAGERHAGFSGRVRRPPFSGVGSEAARLLAADQETFGVDKVCSGAILPSL